MTLALPATTEPAPPITPEERERCSISSSGTKPWTCSTFSG